MASKLTPPQSQKADVRPIAFVLDDQTDGSEPFVLPLYLRPEELTIADQSRLAVHHTFGGAFADSFGAGQQSITLSGTTGWRRVDGGDGRDGLERFQLLRLKVFEEWHRRRLVAVADGRDPSGVKLVFADSLDGIACVVAPQSFTLRRSKSRPLLAQFQIQLAVTERKLDRTYQLLTAKQQADAARPKGLSSLLASIAKLRAMAADVRKFIDERLAAPVREFLRLTQEVYNAVAAAVSDVSGIADSLINVARMSAQAGANVFRSLAAVAGLPALVRAQLMRVASEYTNVLCVLSNSLRQPGVYSEYSPLYGASNCSSTSGGRDLSPMAGQNPFFAVVPVSASAGAATVAPDARSALRALAVADVVASPVPTASIGSLLTAVNAGLVVAA